MAVDKRAVAKNAQLLASKGQFDAAIEEWNKLLTNTSQDGTTYNSIGDLHLKQNARKDACTAYLKAASAFREEGSTLKAIATYKKVIKIDPSQFEVYRHLGELNAERGLLSSAVADYLTLAKFYLKDGKIKEALEVYRTIVSQDPSNLSAKEQMAKLCLKENLKDEAVETYLQLGRERSANFKREEARQAYEAILKIDPGNREAEQYLQMSQNAESEGPEAFSSLPGMGEGKNSEHPERDRMLGEALRRMNDGEFIGSEAILTQLLNGDPGNPEVCQLLARLHLKRGDMSVAMNEYQFLAGAAMRADDLDLAESLIKEFLEVQPDTAAILELLGAVHEKRDDIPRATEYYGKALELLIQHPDPDLPGLQDEIYERIKEISPASPLINKFAASFGGAPNQPSAHNSDMEQILEVATAPPDSVSPRGVTKETVLEPPSSPEAIETIPPTAQTEHLLSSAPVEAAKTLSPQATGPAPPPPPPEPSGDVQSKPGAQPAGVSETSSQMPSPSAGQDQKVRGEKERDFDTHFLLGKAYRNMGLVSEAIEELRVSVNSSKWFLESCIYLAACLKAQGTPKRAITCLEHALGDPRGKKGEQVAVARYELGLLYEMEGLLEKAIRVFESIPAVNDSLQRIESLKQGKVKRSSMGVGQQMAHPTLPAMVGSEGKESKKRRISYL